MLALTTVLLLASVVCTQQGRWPPPVPTLPTSLPTIFPPVRTCSSHDDCIRWHPSKPACCFGTCRVDCDLATLSRKKRCSRPCSSDRDCPPRFKCRVQGACGTICS